MARAALDIKGTDFRSRHKPATKAYDFIAPGIPLTTKNYSNIETASQGVPLANSVDPDI